jgi:hypothetical protein
MLITYVVSLALILMPISASSMILTEIGSSLLTSGSSVVSLLPTSGAGGGQGDVVVCICHPSREVCEQNYYNFVK